MQTFLFLLLAATLLLNNLIFGYPTIPDNLNAERSVDGLYTKRKPAAVWFGPRLGRRKRHSDGNFRGVTLDTNQMDNIMDMIQDTPWAIVAINEGKRHTVNFTPRLGRESGEDMSGGGSSLLNGDRWIQDPDLSDMAQRSPPFAPRLGRRMLPFVAKGHEQ